MLFSPSSLLRRLLDSLVRPTFAGSTEDEANRNADPLLAAVARLQGDRMGRTAPELHAELMEAYLGPVGSGRRCAKSRDKKGICVASKTAWMYAEVLAQESLI